jgi:UDP-glucose 4-epimerase
MNALITGGFGFIGKHLHSTLAKNQINNLPVGYKDPAPGQLIQDLPDSFFEEFDTIFHLAATPRLGISLEKPAEVIENNLTATLRLLEYCRRNTNTILVNVSSSSVKFANLEENPYALSKKFGEDVVNLYRTTYGVKATNVRLFNVYGPGEAYYGKHTTLIKACKRAILTGEPIQVNGDGRIYRDYTHVQDVVNGLLIVAQEMLDGVGKSLYELGASIPVSTREIIDEFDYPVVYGNKRHGDALRTCADFNLKPTGWKPTIHVLDYIQEWKAQGCPDD